MRSRLSDSVEKEYLSHGVIAYFKYGALVVLYYNGMAIQNGSDGSSVSFATDSLWIEDELMGRHDEHNP